MFFVPASFLTTRGKMAEEYVGRSQSLFCSREQRMKGEECRSDVRCCAKAYSCRRVGCRSLTTSTTKQTPQCSHIRLPTNGKESST